MIARLFALGINNPVAVLLGVLALTIGAGMGMSRLNVDTSFGNLIPEDDPARIVYQQIMGEFGSDNRTIVYVQDPALWTPEKLAALDALERALSAIEGVQRVDSVFSLRTIRGKPRTGPDDPPAERIEALPLLDGVPETIEEAQAARELALDNPLYVGNFLSESGEATALIVSASDPDEQTDFSSRLYQAMEAAVGESRDQFEAVFQVGPPRIKEELTVSLFEDFRLLAPLSAAVLVFAIMLFLRSGLAALVPLATSALSIIWTFGVLGWLGIPLNILSAMIPSLIIAIGSTEDTHLIAGYYRGLARGCAEPTDADRRRGLDYLVRHAGLPLVLTVLTTAIGFASNLLSNIGLIQQFAVAATLAMVANGVVTILVVPTLLVHVGSKLPPTPFRSEAEARSAHRPPRNLPARIVRVFRLSQRRFPGGVLALTAGLCLFFVYHAAGLYVTNDPLSYFPEDRPLIQDTQRIHEDMAGIRIFFVALEATEVRAFLDPENIEKLARIQQFMARQGVFDTSVSLADHLAYVNREFRGEFGSTGLPETRQLVAQYLLFFHRSELESYVSHDYQRANIVVRHAISDSHTLNRYIGELEEVLGQITGPGISAEVVGENLMVNRAAESLMVAQVKALGLLLALIFVIMSIMFTSFKGGAIALVPAVIPIALMFGIMGILDIPLNPGTAMVAVIAVGIAVDGTIHLLARYNEQCRRTSDYESAVAAAVDAVATPLVVSSLALAFGFGILLFSNFTVVAQFGALAAATMLISIPANLLVTPIIMARVRLVGLYQIMAMKVDRAVLERSPLFRGMSNYQRRKAILISEMHDFDAGECLVQQGTVGRSMFLILEGDAEVVRRDGGESRTLATLHPGEIFGEIGYVKDIERTANVQARTRVTALRFDFERMQHDLKYFPNIVAKLNFNISGILGERLADVLGKKAES